ncbi:MAG: LPXTG cell wall anchor domain-containing protein, partial [Lachnospiraceae bacterium]|nr:LPXTG cell wall anchor domain-containing protein [Lachnospiraceae bacterium]
GGLEETEDTTEKTTEKSSTTSDSSTSTKSSTAAKTGDDTNMMIYWLLLGMAVLAGCTAVVYRKRKER